MRNFSTPSIEVLTSGKPDLTRKTLSDLFAEFSGQYIAMANKLYGVVIYEDRKLNTGIVTAHGNRISPLFARIWQGRGQPGSNNLLEHDITNAAGMIQHGLSVEEPQSLQPISQRLVSLHVASTLQIPAEAEAVPLGLLSWKIDYTVLTERALRATLQHGIGSLRAFAEHAPSSQYPTLTDLD